MAALRPYLSKTLLQRIDVALACENDYYAHHKDPNKKPPLDWLEFGLFTGGVEEATPRTFRIERTQLEKDGSSHAHLRLTWGTQEQLVWRIVAIVITEDARPVVNDVIFLKDETMDDTFRLSEYLTHGCEGPHWVGYGNQPSGNPQADLESLTSLITQGAIGRVRIIHLKDSIETRVNVTKEALRRLANYNLEFSDHLAEKFAPPLSGVSIKREHHQPDLPWGVFFYDPKDLLIASLFVDMFGQYGYLNDQNVSFQANSATRNLAKDLHGITGIRD